MITLPQWLDLGCDYIRLTAYALVISACIVKCLRRTRIRKVILIGDILVAAALGITNFYNLIGKDALLFRDIILTPASVIWAVLQFVTLLRGEPKE